MEKSIRKSFQAICIMALIYALSGCFSSSPVASREQYRYPEWVPAYHPGVRYYYLPDIETYYDVSSGNFIYFDHGQWLYSGELPPMYRNYDLYTGYGVALNTRVYEPWRYHRQYVSNYPRYYYREVYRDSDTRNIRGYNENDKRPIYSTPENRSNRTPTMRRSNPPSTHSDNQVNRNDNRESQQENYNRRNVGQPVKVKPEMRQRETVPPSQEAGTRSQEQKPTTTGEEKDKEKPGIRRSETAPPSQESGSRRQEQKPSSTVEEKDKAKTNRRR